MCSLMILRGLSAEHPLVIAANRDEQIDRKSSPPGIWRGESRRVLSPRDRVAGGTWLGVNDQGCFAGLTNVHGEDLVAGAPSRGHLPHLALDHQNLEAGVAAVMALVTRQRHSGFQLLVADRERIVVIRNARGSISCEEWQEPVIAVTNEHAAGEWSPRNLDAALVAGLDLPARFDALRAVLEDRGGDGHHVVCKHGESYGTVSSSLIAVPPGDVTGLQWHYAPGPPDTVSYRNYSNLAQRLV